MKNLIKESRELKLADSISESIFKKLKFNFDIRQYFGIDDFVESHQICMLDYLDKNLNKKFKLLNPEEDTIEFREYVSIKKPKSGILSYDEVENSMFWSFVNELINTGYVEEIGGLEFEVMNSEMRFEFGEKYYLDIFIKEKGGKIKVYFLNSIQKLLEKFGVDENETLGQLVKNMLIKKMENKLSTMGIKIKCDLVKFTK